MRLIDTKQLMKNLAKGFVNRTALDGNRTRASRVAGENSTPEPPVLAGIYGITCDATTSHTAAGFPDLHTARQIQRATRL